MPIGSFRETRALQAFADDVGYFETFCYQPLKGQPEMLSLGDVEI
ncbi:hypothetical protein [Xylanibacillus composti]|nr:hypothetical protein [Xylanibacillus composti]